MIGLTFLKELFLIRQTNQKSVIFVTSSICNGCKDLLMISMNYNDIAILKN